MGISRFYTSLKYMDQPWLIQKLHKIAPPFMLAGAAPAFIAYDYFKTPQEERSSQTLIKGASVAFFTIAAALYALGKWGKPDAVTLKHDVQLVWNALKENKIHVPQKLADLLKQAGESENRRLPWKKIHALRQALHEAVPHPISFEGSRVNGKGLIDKVLQIGEDEGGSLLDKLKDLGGELKDLSIMGLFPVLGGITGGMVGNLLNRDNWKADLKNQTKEGFFQYLANIALCNVGAGLSLITLGAIPKYGSKWVTQRGPKMIAMTIGIALVGVIFGSSIANFLGKNFFNPLFEQGPGYALRRLKERVRTEGWGSLFKNLSEERHVEPIDVGLHVDDFATMGMLAGLKWVGPALPFLYSISGYRAGVGYRNGTVTETDSEIQSGFKANPALQTVSAHQRGGVSPFGGATPSYPRTPSSFIRRPDRPFAVFAGDTAFRSATF